LQDTGAKKRGYFGAIHCAKSHPAPKPREERPGSIAAGTYLLFA